MRLNKFSTIMAGVYLPFHCILRIHLTSLSLLSIDSRIQCVCININFHENIFYNSLTCFLFPFYAKTIKKSEYCINYVLCLVFCALHLYSLQIQSHSLTLQIIIIAIIFSLLVHIPHAMPCLVFMSFIIARDKKKKKIL